LCAASLAPLAFASSTRAAGPPVAVVVTEAAQYVPGDVDRPGDEPALPLILGRGGRLFLVNADTLGAHRITSYEGLFDQEQVNGGQAGEVIGVSALMPGRYGFYCPNHPGMDGMLEVEQA
jgi:hypothetical protein